MIDFRYEAPGVLGAITNAPFGSRAMAETARSISGTSCIPIGMTSSPSADVTLPALRRKPGVAGCSGSTRKPTRRMLGEISLSNSSHFPAIANSKCVNPVVLDNRRLERLLAKLRYLQPHFTGLGLKRG